MRVVKAALVTSLFLLIPFQGPFAGPAGGSGQSDVGIGPESTVDPPTVRSAHTRPAGVVSSEGFVWSVSETRSAAAPSPIPQHEETDGYSWSVRDVGPEPALDPTP